MLNLLLDQRAEIFQPVKTADSFKSQTYVWPELPTLTVPCRLQLVPKLNDSPVEGTPKHWRAYLPPEASILTVNDRVRIGTLWYNTTSVYPVHNPRLPGVYLIQAVFVAYDGDVPHAS